MARNRRNDSAVRLAPVLLAVALCALFAGLGVGYVWYKDQISILSGQIKQREQILAKLQRENSTRRDQLATLSSSPALDAAVKKLNLKLNLNLGPPSLSHIIRLLDAPEIEVAARRTAPPEPSPVRAAMTARRE